MDKRKDKMDNYEKFIENHRSQKPHKGSYTKYHRGGESRCVRINGEPVRLTGEAARDYRRREIESTYNVESINGEPPTP
jgi:hypothetical protein